MQPLRRGSCTFQLSASYVSRLVGLKPGERGKLLFCWGEVGLLLGLCSGGAYWLLGGGCHEILGEKRFW